MSLTPASRLPVVYVSHGAPTFALAPGRAGPLLRQAGQRLAGLPGLRAIAVVSPHWMTRGGVLVTGSPAPATLHDFGGFPQPLYALRYPAPGAPAVAREAADALARAGFATDVDPERGLDHGAWVPLTYLAPEALTPVVQISMPFPMDADAAIRMGRALAALRERGVLLVASGSLTHNLRDVGQDDARPANYVQAFTAWARQAVQAHDLDTLAHWADRAPQARRAHPSDDHYWPLVIAVAAGTPGEPVEVIDGGVSHGVLSMEGYVLGELPPAA